MVRYRIQRYDSLLYGFSFLLIRKSESKETSVAVKNFSNFLYADVRRIYRKELMN